MEVTGDLNPSPLRRTLGSESLSRVRADRADERWETGADALQRFCSKEDREVGVPFLIMLGRGQLGRYITGLLSTQGHW